MSIKQDILTMLESRRGKYISGEELAENFGVSRAAVWKAIKMLRSEGHSITAVTNRGYALEISSDKLSEQSVRKHLTGDACLCRIETAGIVESTNTVLKFRGDKGENEGLILIAEGQTNGKGRIGRSFYSPEKTGLYLSVLLRPKIRAEQAMFITTAAAVAVAKAIESETGIESGIKWVNDIYCADRKVCGILTEASMDFETGALAYAVLGIGINISEPEGGFPDDIKEIVGTLRGKEAVGDLKSRLAAAILNYFFEYYKHIEEKTFIDEYKKRSILIGKWVTFARLEEKYEAQVVDIDNNARLVVRYENGEIEAIGAGEVSVRKK